MTARNDTLERLLAPLLATLLVATSVAVPLLDASSAGPGVVIESEHDAATCVVGHDHTICSQAGANRPLPAADSALDGPCLALWTVRRAPVRSVPSRIPLTGRRSRAPPPDRT